MTLSGKKILVTGGAGFIGSHLVEVLATDHRVTVYDNFTSNVVTEGELKHFGVRSVVHGDILDGQKLTKAMVGVDVVFHFAVACVRLSLSEELFVHNVNATGTLTTLLAAKKAGVSRFIYISSSEVYGSAEKTKISENHPINPTTVYGMSKYVGELYTQHFNNMEHVPTVIVRPFNTYGPRSHFDGVYGEVIPRFVLRALNGRQPTIFGSGNQTRDFTYVTDTVAGILKAATSNKSTGHAINIARGQEVSIRDIAKHVCNETGLPAKPEMKPARPNDVIRHFADITKAQAMLSYKPNIAIQDGVRSYVAWIRQTYPDPKKLLKLIPEQNW